MGENNLALVLFDYFRIFEKTILLGRNIIEVFQNFFFTIHMAELHFLFVKVCFNMFFIFFKNT